MRATLAAAREVARQDILQIMREEIALAEFDRSPAATSLYVAPTAGAHADSVRPAPIWYPSAQDAGATDRVPVSESFPGSPAGDGDDPTSPTQQQPHPAAASPTRPAVNPSTVGLRRGRHRASTGKR